MESTHPAPVPNDYMTPGNLPMIREHRQHNRGLGVLKIAEAAREQGARIEWFSPSYAWAILEDRRVPLNRQMVHESRVGAGISADKDLSKKLLEAAQIPVPKGSVVTTEDEAVQAWQEIGTAVVVKPLGG